MALKTQSIPTYASYVQEDEENLQPVQNDRNYRNPFACTNENNAGPLEPLKTQQLHMQDVS